jgi:hypothetical protein
MKLVSRPSLAVLALAVACLGAAAPIDLKAVRFDPLADRPSIAADLASRENEAGYHIVQLKGPMTPERQTWLKGIGARVDGYVPTDGYLMRLQPGQLAALRDWDAVRWIGPFHPAYKLSPEIGSREFSESMRALDATFGVRRLVVTLFPGAEAGPVARRAAALGATVLQTGLTGATSILTLRIGDGATRRLAREQAVAFIEEAPEITFRNDVTSWVIQSNQNGVRSVWSRGLRGEGQVGALIDGALDMNHYQFRDPNGNPIGPNHRKVQAYFGSSGADSHGTHCAGTIAGNMEPMNGQTTNNGMAPQARLVFTNLGAVGSNMYNRLVEQYNAGARVSSNSWGNDGTTSYDNLARALDVFSWDYEDAVVAFAVSNQATLRNPENAKSVLAVGATRQAPSQDQIGSGGRGPTNDGRRKPEIFAPGINIFSARSGTQTGFIAFSGTSMACPGVAGAVLLVRQYFREGWWKAGTRDESFGFTPSGALLRAMVMNAGVDMSGSSGYPSNSEGWGRLLLENALWFAGEPRRLLTFERRNLQGLVTGASREFAVDVRGSAEPLRITMTFTDFPGDAFSNPAVVNDVDLVVVGPDGTTYLGNVIDAATGFSTPDGAPDPRNSTEMVILNNPPRGVYRVRAVGRAVNRGDRQGFAIVATGEVFEVPPIQLRPTP